MADIADVSKEEVQAIYEAIQKTKANILTRLLCASFLFSLGFLGLCSTIEHFADRFFSLARVPLQIKHGLLRRAEDDMTLFSFYPAFADPSGCMRA